MTYGNVFVLVTILSNLTSDDCTIEELTDRLSDLNVEAKLSNGNLFGEIDAIFRIAFNSNSIARRVVKLCEKRNIPFINKHKLNKWEQYLKMVELGIPTPYTRFFRVKERVEGISFPFVIKPLNGMCSEGVYLIENQQELEDTWINDWHYVVQEYMPLGGQAIRLMVVGNQVTFSSRRIAHNGFNASWNYGLTAKRVPFEEMSEEWENFAVNVCNKMDIDIAALDVVESDNGPMVLEVNHHNVRLGMSGHGTDTCRLVAEYIKKRAVKTDHN